VSAVIGSQACLRSACRKACRFKSCLTYLSLVINLATTKKIFYFFKSGHVNVYHSSKLARKLTLIKPLPPRGVRVIFKKISFF
jgi:hypothetical protein